MINIKKINFDKMDGLVPAVIQEEGTGLVLMVGFMNQKALKKTIKTGKVTFYSRSRNELWVKGETSGNYLDLVDIKPDCDNDTLLVTAQPLGPTCHTGEYSCFGGEKSSLSFLAELYELIEDRKRKMPKDSYTTKLFERGLNKIVQKLGEEAVETVIAAKDENRQDLLDEVSDLLYHLLVMLVEKDVPLDDVTNNLMKRHKERRK